MELGLLITSLNNISIGVAIILGVVVVLTSAIRHLARMDHRLVRAFTAMRVVRLLRLKKDGPISPDTVEKVLRALWAESEPAPEELKPGQGDGANGSSPPTSRPPDTDHPGAGHHPPTKAES